MPETELVEGPSAGLYDLWRRVLNAASIGVPLLVGVILSVAGVSGPSLAGVMIVIFIALFIAALVVGSRVTRTMQREMQAGYSTLYDVADFELRDARSLELLRADTVAPETPGRRSLVAGLFRVKPGTVLAKRVKEDDEA